MDNLATSSCRNTVFRLYSIVILKHLVYQTDCILKEDHYRELLIFLQFRRDVLLGDISISVTNKKSHRKGISKSQQWGDKFEYRLGKNSWYRCRIEHTFIPHNYAYKQAPYSCSEIKASIICM